MAANFKEDPFTFARWRRLMRLYARMNLDWLMQDTRTCIICMISDIFTMLSSISSVALLAVRFGGVGELNTGETLFMLGFNGIVNGVFTLLFCNFNVANISRRIGRSQLDHMMIQPLPLYAQLMCEGFAPFTGTGALISGIAVTVWALCLLGWNLAWWAWLVMPLLIACAVAILLMMSYLVSASAFYHPVSCEEISSVMLDALGTLSRFPLGGLGPGLRAVLVTVLPAGLLGWFPALMLLGKARLFPGLLLPMCVAALVSVLAGRAFSRGLKHYVKVGSNRYRGMGHRN